MRVLFINSVVDYGSTGKIVRDLANGLKQEGHEVLIAYGRNGTNNPDDTLDIQDKLGSAWHLLMSRLLGRHGLHSKRATRKLINAIESFKPDVIHMHNLHGYYLHVPMLLKALQNSDAKLVLTLHDCWTFSGSSAYFDYHGVSGWHEGVVQCNSTRDYPEVLGFANQKRNMKWKRNSFTKLNNLSVITPSDWLTQLAQASILGKFPITTIHNGIDLSVFKPTKGLNLKEISDADTVILGVSSIWERRKGLDILIEMSNKLEDHENLVLVGLSQKQIDALPPHVIGISRTSSMEELAKLYSRANVFVNPTLEDNFPTTNLESLACGTPVITFDTGGSPEAIDGSTGVVCKIKTAQSLIESIRNGKFEPGCNSDCVQRAHLMFSKERMIANYLKQLVG
ncbi:hypothetical protein AOC36_02555 [Erysipelothrix larvae]|uniref:Glycosyltransferase subfamily 4-like N-terminal domain-containing protein n=1 Tax=Erysipelothrix larvae TaxID=1514105 RepID=A0A0X8GYT2_9FIRM|nr:glycosyltransferase [Erysipelothrix larvae]AMC92903.1 hypothetical protein AOC36_02555 [Erysipelothrix larvae]